MTDEPEQSLSLPQFLAQRARSASDGRLVLDGVAGLLLATGAALARPLGWMILAPAGVCFAAFGFWGIIDRELSERRPRIGTVASLLLQSARVFVAALGALAGLGVIYGGLAVMLGTWIS